MKLLMISGDRDLIQGREGPFYYLLREFSKYWRRIDIICPATGENLKPFDNVFLYGTDGSIEAIYQKGLEIFNEAKYDLITAHDYPPFRHSRAAIKLKNKLKINFVIEIHHVVGFPRAANCKEWLLKIYFQLFFKNLAKEATAVRVVNKNQTPGFLKKFGVAETKIKYWPSFYLDRNIFQPQDSPKVYDLLFVGRLAENKGLNLLSEILAKLKKDLPDFKIAVVGNGPKESELKAKIENLNLKNNVEFLGWLADNRALAAVYNKAKVLLITSDNEGGPRVGLEAMACGLPVISTKVGIMIDLIQGNENGYLVDWSKDDFLEKIKKVLNNYQNFQREIIIDSVKEFDYQETIKNYAQGLQSLK